jgi:hypothetical protein
MTRSPVALVLVSLAMLATPAMADTTYQCGKRSTMVYVDATQEMIIHRKGEMDISIPYAYAASRLALWATNTDLIECDVGPCAEEWAPQNLPRQVWYILDGTQQVNCTEVK